MSEERIHKEERMTTLAEVAVGLRRLADQVEAGAISYGSGDSLPLPDQVEWEFEIERENKGGRSEYEVEIELKWYV